MTAEREELELIRAHQPVQPTCTTCRRVAELTKAINEAAATEGAA